MMVEEGNIFKKILFKPNKKYEKQAVNDECLHSIS